MADDIDNLVHAPPAKASVHDLADLNGAAVKVFRNATSANSALLKVWREAILRATESGLPPDVTPLTKLLEVPANDPAEQSIR